MPFIGPFVIVDGDGDSANAELLDGQEGAYYRARANHTGTQLAATVSDFDSAVTAGTHANRTDNPHATTKSQVGLANADNTSDANKPVSTAQQAALDLKMNLLTTRRAVADTTTTITTADNKKIVAYSSLSAARAVTFDSAAALGDGFSALIKDESGSIAGAIKLTFVGTIDGVTDGDLVVVAYGAVEVYSNGSALFTR